MHTVKEIKREITRYFRNGGPSEYDQRLNELNRMFISAFAKEHEEVWLGKINRYEPDRGKPYLVRYEGQLVYNFEYAFAIPCYDEKLIALIKERDEAEYTGTCEDSRRVSDILDRIDGLGGVLLVWV